MGKYSESSDCSDLGIGEEKWQLKGKVVLIVTVNADQRGIGATTALTLAYFRPRKLILACRNMDNGKAAVEEILSTVPKVDPESIVLKKIDLSSLTSIKLFAEDFLKEEPELHVLIANAAVIGTRLRKLTPEGNEISYATNHLGIYFFTFHHRYL